MKWEESSRGDEGPIGEVAQVIGYHGVTVVVGHQEEGTGRGSGKAGRSRTGRGIIQRKIIDGWNADGMKRQVRAALSHVV